MAKKTWLAWSLLGCLLLGLNLAPVRAETPKPAWIDRTTISGMTILLQTTETEPVEVALLLKSGSGLDPIGKKGTALVMNSLVRVKLNYGEVELGEVEVDTYPDYTLIRFQTTAENLEEVLQAIKELLTYPLYSYDVVTDLKGLFSTDLMALPAVTQSYYQLTREFYGVNHPYNDALAPEVVRSITGHDVYQWYRRTYQPGNAVLSISGKTDYNIAKLESYFAKLRSEPVDHRLLVEQVKLPQDRVLEREDPNGKVTSISIGFSAPRISDPEYPAFRLLAYYLEEYQYYFEELRVNQGLFYASLVYYNYLQKPQAPNIVFITMTAPQSLPVVEAKTVALVKQFIEQGLTQETIDQVVKAMTNQAKARQAAGKGLATKNILSHYLQNKLVYDDQLLAALAKLKPDDVKQAAAKYLQHYIRVAYIPKDIEADL